MLLENTCMLQKSYIVLFYFFKVIFTHVSMSSSTCLMLLMMKIIYIQLDCLQFGWQLKQKKIDRNSNIVKNKECAVWPVSV